MGSRAKLANVPKLHELIQHQVRRVFAARARYPFLLPGLTRLAEPVMRDMKKELKKEMEGIMPNP